MDISLIDQFIKETGNDIPDGMDLSEWSVGYIGWLEKRVPQWIDVKINQPEIGDCVLTCNLDGICQDERDPVEGFIDLDDEKWYRPWTEPAHELTPTHWMVLPEIPQRGTEAEP